MAQEYQLRLQQLVSQLLLLQQSVALHLTTSIWDCFLWIDRSVSVTIGVHLPGIDGLLQGTLGRELLLQNYYNNVKSKRRVVTL